MKGTIVSIETGILYGLLTSAISCFILIILGLTFDELEISSLTYVVPLLLPIAIHKLDAFKPYKIINPIIVNTTKHLITTLTTMYTFIFVEAETKEVLYFYIIFYIIGIFILIARIQLKVRGYLNENIQPQLQYKPDNIVQTPEYNVQSPENMSSKDESFINTFIKAIKTKAERRALKIYLVAIQITILLILYTQIQTEFKDEISLNESLNQFNNKSIFNTLFEYNYGTIINSNPPSIVNLRNNKSEKIPNIYLDKRPTIIVDWDNSSKRLDTSTAYIDIDLNTSTTYKELTYKNIPKSKDPVTFIIDSVGSTKLSRIIAIATHDTNQILLSIGKLTYNQDKKQNNIYIYAHEIKCSNEEYTNIIKKIIKADHGAIIYNKNHILQQYKQDETNIITTNYTSSYEIIEIISMNLPFLSGYNTATTDKHIIHLLDSDSSLYNTIEYQTENLTIYSIINNCKTKTLNLNLNNNKRIYIYIGHDTIDYININNMCDDTTYIYIDNCINKILNFKTNPIAQNNIFIYSMRGGSNINITNNLNSLTYVNGSSQTTDTISFIRTDTNTINVSNLNIFGQAELKLYNKININNTISPINLAKLSEFSYPKNKKQLINNLKEHRAKTNRHTINKYEAAIYYLTTLDNIYLHYVNNYLSTFGLHKLQWLFVHLFLIIAFGLLIFLTYDTTYKQISQKTTNDNNQIERMLDSIFSATVIFYTISLKVIDIHVNSAENESNKNIFKRLYPYLMIAILLLYYFLGLLITIITVKHILILDQPINQN